MNICMFSRIMPAHALGGMQDHVQSLSAGLAQKGHRVVIITTARTDEKEFDSVDGVGIYFLKDTPLGRNTSRYWFAAAEKFEQLHLEKPFDLLHSQSVGAYGVHKKNLHRKYRLPLVTTLHGTHLDLLTTSWHTDLSPMNPQGIARFFALSANLLYRYTVRDVWFIRGSDMVIATSDADAWKYKTLYRLRDTQIRQVYNGIDTNLFAPCRDTSKLQSPRSELKIDPNQKIILALARLQKDKGVQNAIAVLPRVLEEISACLILVGDGDYRTELEKLAREKGVAERVRFVGAQPLAECARYFNLCDIFVDPTLRTDGYDLTIAEAMACGKPVIASDVGANATLIETQHDGILIPRGDNETLAREILHVLDDDALAQTMGARGREKIVAHFSLATMVNRMEKVYKEISDRRSRDP